MNSDIHGFRKLPFLERQKVLEERGFHITENISCKSFVDIADKMSENVVGVYHLPFSIATNFRVNGRDILIPMVTEEPSVVAAASCAAKTTRASGGFRCFGSKSNMIGQIQLMGPFHREELEKQLYDRKHFLLELANSASPGMVSRGGGARDISVRFIETSRGVMAIVHLVVDVQDAMGANAVNSMVEKISSQVCLLTGAESRLRILSNYCEDRLFGAEAEWTPEILEEMVHHRWKGVDIIERILDAYAFAESDYYRACTHNKGIMNGVDAVALATGNDFRAIESCIHLYAGRSGAYKPLSKFEKLPCGKLKGSIALPLAIGIVGGATRSLPAARLALGILEIEKSSDLGMVMAAVGLAQNFAALVALVTVGIQEGHMKLHSHNIATQVLESQGSFDKVKIEELARKLVEGKNITHSFAKLLLSEL